MPQQTIQAIINQYDANLKYTFLLTDDLSQAQLTAIPNKGLVNHPAFTIGHLVTGSALMYKYLGGTYTIPDGWDELFRRNGPGDPRLPNSNNEKYPPKKQLLDELDKQHEWVKKSLFKLTDASLQEPVTWRFNQHMPTQLDLIMFMCISHENMHLGQLAAWRRAMDLPSALAEL